MKRTRHHRIAAAAALLLACVGSGIPVSHAAIVRLDFSGTVTEIDSAVADVFSMGDPISGSLFMDTSTPDARPSISTWAFYQHAVVSGGISVSGYPAPVSTPLPASMAGVHMYNDDPAQGDAFGATTGLEHVDMGGFQADFFRILSSPMLPGPNVWDTLEMPTTTADLAIFPGLVWWLDLSAEQYLIRGVVTDFQLTVVPLPSAWVLLLGALGMLPSHGRQRMRRLRRAD